MKKFRYMIPDRLDQETYDKYLANNQEAEAIYNALMETYDRKTSKFLLVTGEDGYELYHRLNGKYKLWQVGSKDTVAEEIAFSYLLYIACHDKTKYRAEFVKELPPDFDPNVIRSNRFSEKMKKVYG